MFKGTTGDPTPHNGVSNDDGAPCVTDNQSSVDSDSGLHGLVGAQLSPV